MHRNIYGKAIDWPFGAEYVTRKLILDVNFEKDGEADYDGRTVGVQVDAFWDFVQTGIPAGAVAQIQGELQFGILGSHHGEVFDQTITTGGRERIIFDLQKGTKINVPATSVRLFVLDKSFYGPGGPAGLTRSPFTVNASCTRWPLPACKCPTLTQRAKWAGVGKAPFFRVPMYASTVSVMIAGPPPNGFVVQFQNDDGSVIMGEITVPDGSFAQDIKIPQGATFIQMAPPLGVGITDFIAIFELDL